MAHIRKADGNQATLVGQLRKVPGISVAHTHTIGKGFPDLAIGYKGRNFFFEVKDPAQPPSARKLTPDEREWHRAWMGQVHTVETFDDVLKILNGSVGLL